MMITVNRIQDRITGMVNGQSFSCTFSEEKYNAMKVLEDKSLQVTTMEDLKDIVALFEPMTKESYKELIESKTPHLMVNTATNQFFLKVGNHVSTKPLPSSFADRIIKAVEKGIEIEPLIKAWTRFLRPIPGRPGYSEQRAEDFAEYISAPYVNTDLANKLMEEEGLSLETAKQHATTTQVAITREGLLVCYKVSEEVTTKFSLDADGDAILVDRYSKTIDPDTGIITYAEPEYVEDRVFRPAIMGESGDEFVCEDMSGNKTTGHRIRVGCSHYLPSWSQVSRPGCKGLHCGGLAYIKGYQNQGTTTHNIFVDPADIHSINIGYGSDGAMTTRRYFVHSSFAGVNKGIYHSSTYAALNDAEYASLLEEVIALESHSKLKKVENDLNEAIALA